MSGFSGSGGGGSLTPSFDFKASVRAATVIALPAYTQVGNVLTEVGVGALPLIDTVALVNTNRLLVKNEGGGTSIANGIYDVTSVGSGATPWILTRSADADTDAEVTAGMIVPVEEGAVNADTLWILATNNPITLNATPLTFVPFITPVANASTVVKGVVEIGIQAETYAGAPYAGGTGAALVPSITNLLVRRTAATALYSISAGPAPAARGLTAIDFQSIRTAAAQVASGGQSSAFGVYNTASGPGSTAIGRSNTASVVYASAVGFSNSASGVNSSAFGYLNTAGGLRSSAFGHNNVASAYRACAFGGFNTASGYRGCAFGHFNTASADSTTAFGVGNKAVYLAASAVGGGNAAYGVSCNAFGGGNIVHTGFTRSSAFGSGNDVRATDASAFGRLNFVGSAAYTATKSSAFGYGNQVAQLAAATKASAFGYYNRVNNANYSSAFGAKNLVGSAGFTALKSSAFGYGNLIAQTANADWSSAVGYRNAARALACNAFGFVNGAAAAYAQAFGSGNGAVGAYSNAFGVANLAGSAHTSSFGFNNIVGYVLTPAVNASAFGYSNFIFSSDFASAVGAKNIVGYGAITATRSSAFGYNNRIGQTTNANYASAVGYKNTLNNSAYASTFGCLNIMGSTAAAPSGSAFGISNVVNNAQYGAAFGGGNVVGSAAYTATKSSAFGYGNLIGQLGNANGGAAVGYKNVIDGLNATAMGYSNVCYGRGAVLGYRNRMQAAAYAGFAVGGRNSVYSNIGSAFGYRNTVGVLGGAYTATKSSAFGYKNQIAQTASADRSAAFGYNNRINKAINGSAVGTYNYIGTAAYNAFGGSAFGYFNRIGQVANATLASAFGYFNFAENTMAVAFGSINRVFGYKATGVGVQNFVGSAANSAYYSVAVGNHNYVGNLGGGNAAKANAFGYKNSILKSDYASAFGVRNTVGTTAYTATKSSAFGYNNFIGTTANADFTSAIGFNNVINNVTYGSAFGVKNLVGSTAYAAAKSSAFGYNNKIAQDANSNGSAAFGYQNTITNGTLQFAFGGSNFIGTAAFSGTKVSAVGYGNRISIYANTLYGNAVGFQNRLDNANYGSSFGSKNRVGYTGFTALKSSAFGHGNLIGQAANSNNASAFGYKNTINANNASAFGYKCTVTGLGANAFGYNAVNRITTTTVINGPIMVRKDNGDGTTPALRFQIFNGAVVVLESQEIDFTAAAADFEIALPAGVTWFFNEIDLKTTNVAALVTQPTIQAGIAGGGANSSKYLAPTLTTLLTAAGKRERYQTLLADDGESSAANLSVGFTVAAAAGTFKGRFILMGILEETQ